MSWFKFIYSLIALIVLTSPQTGHTQTKSIQYFTDADKAALNSSSERYKLLSSSKANYPLEVKKLGHQGQVFLKGLVGSDGAVENLAVVKSSLSQLLDQSAMEAASRYTFSPGKDTNGNKIALPVLISVEFYKYKNKDAGLLSYTCSDFLVDATWWSKTHNDPEFKDYELKKLLGGFEMLTQPTDTKALERLSSNIIKIHEKWNRVFDKCANKPDAIMLKIYDKKLYKIAKKMN